MKDLFQRVRELGLPRGKYALFGSAPMCIRGRRDCNHDLDVIITEDVWREYSCKEGWEVRKMHHGSEYLWNNDLELWKDWKPGKWNIDQLIQEAEITEELPFARLERVIEYKKFNARKKDLKDIEIIEKFLRAD